MLSRCSSGTLNSSSGSSSFSRLTSSRRGAYRLAGPVQETTQVLPSLQCLKRSHKPPTGLVYYGQNWQVLLALLALAPLHMHSSRKAGQAREHALSSCQDSHSGQVSRP